MLDAPEEFCAIIIIASKSRFCLGINLSGRRLWNFVVITTQLHLPSVDETRQQTLVFYE